MSKTKTKIQKLIKVGNSYALTIDKGFVSHLLEDGQVEYAVEYNEDSGSITARPEVEVKTPKKLSTTEKQERLAAKISPELQEWTKNFIEENQESLDELANL